MLDFIFQLFFVKARADVIPLCDVAFYFGARNVYDKAVIFQDDFKGVMIDSIGHWIAILYWVLGRDGLIRYLGFVLFRGLHKQREGLICRGGVRDLREGNFLIIPPMFGQCVCVTD